MNATHNVAATATVFVVGSYMHAHTLELDQLPARGESLIARRHFSEHGGKGFNLGVGLRRLGVDVHLLLPVGTDAAGDAAAACLQHERLPPQGVLRLGAQSGFGVGFVDAAGDNFLATIAGANGLLTTHHIDAAEAVIAAADWVCGQLEAPQPALHRAFELARRHGASTYLNPSPWQALQPGLLALTDVLVLNAREAVALCGDAGDPDRPAARWRAELPTLAQRIGWHGRLLVVTLGERGCVALQAGSPALNQSAYAIVQQDATGAGDAFGSGLLQALQAGVDLPAALRAASACGAIVASRHGVLEALPTVEEVAAFSRAAALKPVEF